MNVKGPDDEPWIFPSPSFYVFLTHSKELIDENDNHGPCNFSELGLENNNKFTRFVRKLFQEITLRTTYLIASQGYGYKVTL